MGFTGDYKEYYSDHTCINGWAYLTLANYLCKKIFPESITVAEDVSGFPGIARSIHDGGVGFDYRLNMYVPDLWIKMLKDQTDEEWDIGHLVHAFKNKRKDEKVVNYCESHDQAIVGDKTISTWLFEAQLYTNMSKFNEETIVIARGMALHKIIRFITLIGGNSYLNFMGNEFGHPEWIDFPRLQNGWSYENCRRRWDLRDNQDLRYHFLYQWDIQMLKLEEKYNLLEKCDKNYYIYYKDAKIVTFETEDVLIIFNFHPSQVI